MAGDTQFSSRLRKSQLRMSSFQLENEKELLEYLSRLQKPRQSVVLLYFPEIWVVKCDDHKINPNDKEMDHAVG